MSNIYLLRLFLLWMMYEVNHITTNSGKSSVTSGACVLPPPSEGFSFHSPCFASSSTSVYPSDMSTPSGEIAPPAKASGAGSGVRSRFLEMSRGW
ncbi:hypothetical protein YC2023_085216 [Brassica napus]